MACVCRERRDRTGGAAGVGVVMPKDVDRVQRESELTHRLPSVLASSPSTLECEVQAAGTGVHLLAPLLLLPVLVGPLQRGGRRQR